eukprot:15229464-Alexandrium_andersonii.AAC.1
MSASLVGSEMCIRDSPAPRQSYRPQNPPTGASGAHERTGGASQRGPGAVSYTHLTLPTICSV